MEETIEKRGPGRPKKTEDAVNEVAPVISMETFMQFMAQQNEANREMMIAAIHEIKKPNEVEQAKIDREAEQLRQRTAQRIEAAKLEEGSTKARQANCLHQRENGSTAFVAQVNTNGFFVPFCPQCHLVLPQIKATANMMTEGVGLSKWQNVTEAGLRKMAAQSSEPIPPVALPSNLVAA